MACGSEFNPANGVDSGPMYITWAARSETTTPYALQILSRPRCLGNFSAADAVFECDMDAHAVRLATRFAPRLQSTASTVRTVVRPRPT
jgi:hypothetical protein